MSKQFFTSLFIIACSAVFAQESQSPWFSQVNAAAYYAHRIASTTDDLTQDELNVFNDLEKGSFHSAYEIGVGRTMREHLAVSATLRLSKRGFQTDTLTDASISIMRYGYTFVDFPIVVRSMFWDEEGWRPFVGVGANLSFLIADQTTYKRIGQTPWFEMPSSDAPNNFQFGIIASAGFTKRIQSLSSILLSLEYYQSVSPLYNGVLERRLNHLGLNVGFTRQF